MICRVLDFYRHLYCGFGFMAKVCWKWGPVGQNVKLGKCVTSVLLLQVT